VQQILRHLPKIFGNPKDEIAAHGEEYVDPAID